MVGEIGESKYESLSVGDRVVSRVAHASDTVTGGDSVFKIPEGISDDQAAWFALAMIGFMGAKAGGYRLGDSIAVVGAGPIGQMTLRWAVAAGARHAVMIDTVPMRLEMAKAGGATCVIGKIASEAEEVLRQVCGGQLPRVLTDSTGYANVFSDVLKLPRDRGTVVLLGDTGTPSEQRLTLDVVRRGIEIHGAHVMHETAEWTERTIIELFFSLLQRGIFRVDGLNTHTFAAADCKQAFDLTTERRAETMGVLFDWS
jgi:threonine dehydrogenase-like Zn-dependent dehydrogenase